MCHWFDSSLWHHFALVMEQVYVSDSKSEFCGFESHLGHHIEAHCLPDRNVGKLSRAKGFKSPGLVVCFNMVIGGSPSGKAPDFDSGMHRFESYTPSQNVRLVQRYERYPDTVEVSGSIPLSDTRFWRVKQLGWPATSLEN